MERKNRKLQAIVFDLDGLMVDSEPLARRAWERVLEGYGQSLDDDTYNRMVGLRLQESSLLVKQAYSLPVSPAELATRKQGFMTGVLTAGIPLMPGLEELMEKIEDSEIPWAVATSSNRAYARRILDQLGLLASCRAIAAGDQVERGKPAPDIYKLATGRLGLLPAQCLALEDSLPGSRAAVAAGLVTVAVPSGHANAEDLAFVDYVYDSLHDVADNLDQLLGFGTD